jgi:hypothetical protein
MSAAENGSRLLGYPSAKAHNDFLSIHFAVQHELIAEQHHGFGDAK